MNAHKSFPARNAFAVIGNLTKPSSGGYTWNFAEAGAKLHRASKFWSNWKKTHAAGASPRAKKGK